MKIEWKPPHDSLRYQFLTENHEVIHTGACTCYAQTIYNYREHVASNPKWYDVYWADSVSNHFNSTRTTKRFIKAISKSDLFSNCYVEILNEKQCNKSFLGVLNKDTKSKWWISLRHDIDVTTAQEMFLVGIMIRTISSRPHVITNFLKLYKLYGKKYNVDHLFMVAFSLSWDEKANNEYGGHQMISSSFCYLSGKTFKDYLEYARTFDTIRNFKSYNHNIKEGIEGYFLVYEKNPRTKWSTKVRAGGMKFKRGAIKTYFDGELFNKLYDKDVSLVCRNSYY